MAETAVNDVIDAIGGAGPGAQPSTILDTLVSDGFADVTMTDALGRVQANVLETNVATEANPVVADYVAAAAGL